MRRRFRSTASGDTRQRTALLVALAVVLVGGLTLALCSRGPREEAAPPGEESSTETAAVEEPVPEEPTPPPGPVVVTHTIASGETFGQILEDHDIRGGPGIVEAALPHYDLTAIRAGKILEFTFDGQPPVATQLAYVIDEDQTLIVDLLAEGGPAAAMELTEYDTAVAVRTFVLESSLWDAALGEGFRPKDILRMARIFEYDLDFNYELKKGARFVLVLDELSRDGTFVKAGEFHAAMLVNGDKTYTLIRHEVSEGTFDWYSPDGHSHHRPFLRSPLEYTRITSGWNLKRFDPITGKQTGHHGVDFGAPRGTPIRASGDGVVVRAGRNGGHGNYVKLDHAELGPYHTSYSHMSAIHVKKGQHVEQGELIGEVGSTGHSTGPHLHYEFHVDGKRVDPLGETLPTTTALVGDALAEFEQVRDEWLPVLENGSLGTEKPTLAPPIPEVPEVLLLEGIELPPQE